MSILNHNLRVEQLIDYREVIDSYIPKDELFEFYKTNMVKSLYEFLNDEKYFKDVELNKDGQYKLQMDLFVFSSEEINKLLEEVYQKGRNDQFNSMIDFSR